MFKAHHRLLQKDVISLDPGLSREQLQGWADGDLLACPECGTDVGFRSGDLRRPHFFHRALVDCKYHPGEPAVIAARAILYAFLVQKAGPMGGEVDIEKRLPGMPDRELIDVWLQLPGKPPVAYRIFQRGPQPSRLRAVAELLEAAGAVTWYMLTASRLQDAPPDGLELAEDEAFIPAFDRHLFFSRRWDRYYQYRLELAESDSLLYIDPQAERLILFRGLWHPPDCNPNVFEYLERFDDPIAEIKLLPDGEFVFPRELPLKAQWEAWAEKENQRLEAEKRRAEEQRQAKEQQALLRAQEKAALQERIEASRAVATEAAPAPSGQQYRPVSRSADENPFACAERDWQHLVRLEYTGLYCRPGASARIVDIAEVVATKCGLKAQHFNFRDMAVLDAIRCFFEDEARTRPVRVRGGSVVNTL